MRRGQAAGACTCEPARVLQPWFGQLQLCKWGWGNGDQAAACFVEREARICSHAWVAAAPPRRAGLCAYSWLLRAQGCQGCSLALGSLLRHLGSFHPDNLEGAEFLLVHGSPGSMEQHTQLCTLTAWDSVSFSLLGLGQEQHCPELPLWSQHSWAAGASPSPSGTIWPDPIAAAPLECELSASSPCPPRSDLHDGNSAPPLSSV